MKYRTFSTTFVLFQIILSTADATATAMSFSDPAFRVAQDISYFTTIIEGVDLVLIPVESGLPISAIKSEGGDKIEDQDSLLLKFSQAVLLSEIDLTELFDKDSPVVSDSQIGVSRLSNSESTVFSSINSATNGAIVPSFTEIVASSILFSAPGMFI